MTVSPGESPGRRLVVGTAGHVDHGKTRLVEALTGIDCDRWDEEKRRGITIDLGFAHRRETLADGGVLQIGFVDVPGHERFVHNALAGLGGIDLMMLVVAADEGIKPQTREHLAICELLRIPAGVVALTKRDLVDAELLELAGLELSEALQGTPFADVPVVPVSSRTGEGLDELVSALVAAGQRRSGGAGRQGAPLRLPVDRAFQLQGLGVLVTGTLFDGAVGASDTVRLLPADVTARVRSVQVHGEERPEARAGERVALQLAGVGLQEVRRGDVVVSERRELEATRRLLVRMRLLEEAPDLRLSRRRPIELRLHHLASDRKARLRPVFDLPAPPAEAASASSEEHATDASGASDASGFLAEVLLDRPIVAVRGDRFVLRRPSPRATVGGGEVLDPAWHSGRQGAAAAKGLASSGEEAVLTWARRAGEAGLEALTVARRLGEGVEVSESRLRALAEKHRLVEAPASGARAGRWLSPATIERVGRRARKLVEEFFAADRLAPGMPKASLLSALLPEPAQPLGEVYLGWFEAQKLLRVEGDRVGIPGRGGMSAAESDLATRIVQAFEEQGYSPGSPAEVCRQLGAKPQLFEGLMKHLVSSGSLARLSGDLIVARGALERLEREVLAESWASFTVPEFKQRFDLTRKWAIPLLEHLDKRSVTRRDGDRRVVRRPAVR
ncbi:MAG: selenocysteine-specific translation elongation factor [Acidobacteria bacterium]|nr:MAG: selenocysteine-specific translation elongation factor [Acidobacteriota bacterium]REK11787.1 MAG: selenocysteine-specific translation elongation factor [Acidobacteriota bacterium]